MKVQACQKLLNHRVTTALRSQKSLNASKIHLAQPAPRDHKARPAFIPESVRQKQADESVKMDVDDETDSSGMPTKFTKAEMEAIQEEGWKEYFAQGVIPFMGDQSQKDGYILADDEWKYDKIPEIINGHNIIDFMDPDIMEKLDALEREEEEIERLEAAAAADKDSSEGLDDEEVISLPTGKTFPFPSSTTDRCSRRSSCVVCVAKRRC